MRCLILTRGNHIGDPAGHQVIAFGMHRDRLAQLLDFHFVEQQVHDPADLERGLADTEPDIVIAMAYWRDPVDRLIELFRAAYERPNRPRLVFLDYYAPTCSPHFGVLPWVDCYLKRQVLRDRSLYQRDYRGGYIFTDFLVERFGYELDGWFFGSKPDPACVDRIVPAWNLGVVPRYRHMLNVSRRVGLPWRARPFAVNQRIGMSIRSGKREWYQEYRQHCLDLLAAWPGRRRVTGTTRIGYRRYLAELALSRIAVSPFGWGELCFRDYEAVCLGALLVKPSMSHLETSPDIFIENETYVPVRWDLSDLTEVCEHYLSHPDEAKRIIRAAQDVLSRYYEDDGFVENIRRMLRCIDMA